MRCSLEENDKIKQEINPRKINEPKTPYHGPMEEEPGCGVYSSALSCLDLLSNMVTKAQHALRQYDASLHGAVAVISLAHADSGEPGMSPLRLEEEVTTALHSGLTYRQVGAGCMHPLYSSS